MKEKRSSYRSEEKTNERSNLDSVERMANDDSGDPGDESGGVVLSGVAGGHLASPMEEKKTRVS